MRCFTMSSPRISKNPGIRDSAGQKDSIKYLAGMEKFFFRGYCQERKMSSTVREKHRHVEDIIFSVMI